METIVLKNYVVLKKVEVTDNYVIGIFISGTKYERKIFYVII